MEVAESRDLLEEFLAVGVGSDAEGTVELSVGEDEEHLAVDRVRLERVRVRTKLNRHAHAVQDTGQAERSARILSTTNTDLPTDLPTYT